MLKVCLMMIIVNDIQNRTKNIDLLDSGRVQGERY